MDADWDHDAPLSIGERLLTIAELVAGLTAVVVLVGLSARWSGAVTGLLFG